MVANFEMENLSALHASREVCFAGDMVFLNGQIDYPNTPQPLAGYPLLVTFHHAGSNTCDDLEAFANLALESGYAVFRWDKRGTGKSGGGAKGSTLMDNVLAYQTAIAQPYVNRSKTVLMGLADGTLMLRDVYEQLARHNAPFGVLLIANMLDKRDILRIRANVKIIMGENDWRSWQLYGKEAGESHRRAYNFDSSFNIAQHADCDLRDTRLAERPIHTGAQQLIQEWLKSLV